MAERGISLPTQIWYANGEIGDIIALHTADYQVQYKLTTSGSTLQ